MSKCLLVADPHIHSHKESINRLNDCLDVLEWVFETAKQEQCNNIFFLGDLFHERSKIDVLNYLRTFEVFAKYMLTDEPLFDVWLLIGNHDMYHKEKWDVNSVKPLSAIPRIHVVDRPTTISIDGRPIDFCPHTEKPIHELEKLANSGSELLFGHMAVDGAVLNKVFGTKSDVIVEYDNDMVRVSPRIFAAWKKVYLGHYHSSQEIDHVEYVGSPMQLNFGEAFEQKHIILLDLETLEHSYIRNNFSPRHFILAPEEVPDHDLSNAFVRIVVNDISSKELVDLRNSILSTANIASLDFKEAERNNEECLVLLNDAKSMLLDEDDMINSYVDSIDVPDTLDVERLKKKGRSICAMAN